MLGKQVASFGLVAFFLAGCGTQLPALVDRSVLPVDQLVRKIHCEFAEAVHAEIDQGYVFLLDWQGSYNITLKANEAGTLAADANKIPADIGRSSVVVGFGADIKAAANRTAVLKYDLEVSDVKRDASSCAGSAVAHPLLRGDLGFREWLDTALKASVVEEGQDPQERLTSIGHTFQFVLTTTAGASPVFTIVPKPIVVNPSLSVSREEDNSVDVVLAKKKGAGSPVYVRTLSAIQTSDLKKLDAQRDKAAGDARRSEANLAELRSLQGSIGGITAKLQTKGVMSLDGARSDNPPDDARRDIEELDRLQAKARSLGSEMELTTMRDRADRTALAAVERMKAIRARPEGPSAIVSRRIGTGSPSDNPNLRDTQTQLTLERVLGNLRVPGI
jgi:hypothetical protein